MPFFHDQSRTELRRAWLTAWRRHVNAEPLEPLQAQMADVAALHPEYSPVLESEAALDRDWTPEGGAENPFLHLSMHLAIREQVATDRPAGIAAAHAALARRLGSVHAAEHAMLEKLGEALWQAQRAGRAPDEQAYLAAIQGLVR
jgi:hypothetical protein